MRPSDLSAEQLAFLRAASPAQRAALALRLSEIAIRAQRLELARVNPELDELGVKLLWAEINYGKELADRVRAHLAKRAMT